METVIETLQDDGRFNRFLKAVFTTNFWEILEGKGPFTVLAPLDASFDNLPDDVWEQLLKDKSRLTDIVSQHIAIGNLSVADLEEMDEFKNMNNMGLAIEKHNEGLIIGSAKIVEGDIFCANGIIHAIDFVLIS